MLTLGLAGLIQIDLPAAVTVRLSDGGVVKWGSDVFASRHATFGAIGSIESLEEGVGQEVPAAQLVLLPPTTAAAADLTAPGNQRSRVRMWLAEYATGTNLVVGAPDLLFDGFLDQATLTVGLDTRELAVSVVPQLERLFELNTGNSLNPTWHKSIWPGETGHDNATGLGRAVAWGVEAPPSRYAAQGGGGGGAGWFGGQVREL